MIPDHNKTADAPHFDYIVIGSGSAGSALTYRLGENKAHKILGLEYVAQMLVRLAKCQQLCLIQ